MENRKIRYSKHVLKESLSELLKTKKVSEITVRKLCELADLNRSTFYAHYEDIYAIFDEYENDFISSLPVILDEDIDLKTAIRNLIAFSKENIHLVRAFTYDGHLCAKMNERSIALWSREKERTPKQRSAFIFLSHYFTMGLFDSLIYWINEENALTLDDVTDIVCEAFEALTDIRLRRS